MHTYYAIIAFVAYYDKSLEFWLTQGQIRNPLLINFLKSDLSIISDDRVDREK